MDLTHLFWFTAFLQAFFLIDYFYSSHQSRVRAKQLMDRVKFDHKREGWR